MSVAHILGNRRNGLRKTGSGTMLTGCCLLFFIWPGFPLLESVLAPQAQAADEQHDDHAGHDHGEHGGHDAYKDDHAGTTTTKTKAVTIATGTTNTQATTTSKTTASV